MKVVLLIILCCFFVEYSNSQHVPILKPTKEKLTKVSPKAVSLFDEGVNAFKQGDREIAKEKFNLSIEADPSFAEAYINLSKVYESEANLEQAKSVMLNAINSMIPLNSRAFEQLGVISMKTEEYDVAVYNFKQAVSLENQNARYLFFSGLALIKNRNFREAEEFFNKSLAIENSSKVKIGLSNAQIEQSKYEDAIKTLKSIDGYESLSIACLNLAIAMHSKGSKDEAVKYLEMAKNNGGESESQFFNLSGLIHSENNNDEEAMKNFDKAIQMDGGISSYYNDRAAHQIKVENFQDALSDLNKALKLEPDFSKAYYNRGIAKEMLRDEEGACLDWEYAFFLGYQKAEELLNNPICN